MNVFTFGRLEVSRSTTRENGIINCDYRLFTLTLSSYSIVLVLETLYTVTDEDTIDEARSIAFDRMTFKQGGEDETLVIRISEDSDDVGD